MTRQQFTLGDALKFLYKHRGKRIYPGEGLNKLALRVMQASSRNCLHTVAQDGQLTGLSIAWVQQGELFVECLIAINSDALAALIAKARQLGAKTVRYHKHGREFTLTAEQTLKLFNLYGR